MKQIRLGLVVAFLLARAGTLCLAQNVRRESPLGSSFSRFNRAAEKQGIAGWLQPPYENPGTQVRITFDARNADVTLTTNRAYTMDRLLAQAREIARQTGLTKADYILLQGARTLSVDIECNKYLRMHDRQTDFDLDLAGLASSLRRLPLSAPAIIAVETDDADSVILQQNTLQRPLTDFWFARPETIAAGTHLRFHAQIPWYAYPFVALFCLLLVGVPLIPIWGARVRWKQMQAPQQEEKPLTPEEVQARYEKRKPIWIGLLIPLAPFLFFLLGDPLRALGSAFLLLPFSPKWALLMPILFLVTLLGSQLIVWGLARRYRLPKAEPTPEMKTARATLIPILMMMALPAVLLPLLLLLPVTSLRQFTFRRDLAYGLVGLGFLWVPLSVLLIRFATRKMRTVLTEGPWHDMAHDLALQAGVRVKKLVLIQSSTANAFASPFGTVALTTALLEKMEPDEIRAVIAHELGYLKCGHPQRTLYLSLLTLGLLFGGWLFCSLRFLPHASHSVRFALDNPLTGLIFFNVVLLLILGPGRRRREEEADRIAVALTGDPELVIRALIHLHTVNAVPFRLKRSDEALSSHPSLTRRIEAIRQQVATKV
ncbi:MAG TPA: M48 family metalloprotease [Chthonomonadaceae bacterium]|nr:M48 family metalloprotease [Chthonomonadaceae bacterium]